MRTRDAADRQLERILYLLPAAGREGGVELEELADRLGVPPERVLSDLEEVWDRVFYHPSGGADDINITLEANRVQVRAGDKFPRPPRLGLREALALHLGLCMVAAGRSGEERRRILTLARRLERELAAVAAEEFVPRYRLESGAGEDEIRTLLFRAARERRPVRLRYLKPDAGEPEDRVLEPWTLAHATGHWYAIGRADGGDLRDTVESDAASHANPAERADPDAPAEEADGIAAGQGSSATTDGVRVFRLDRIVQIEVLEGAFSVPEEFDPHDYLKDGRVYRAQEETEVTVRYLPRIARWLVERGWGEPEEDGSLICTHPVADPGWAVRHVLTYGADAEVLAPAEVRRFVRETVEAIAAAHA